jgi:hypothetical protein
MARTTNHGDVATACGISTGMRTQISEPASARSRWAIINVAFRSAKDDLPGSYFRPAPLVEKWRDVASQTIRSRVNRCLIRFHGPPIVSIPAGPV